MATPRKAGPRPVRKVTDQDKPTLLKVAVDLDELENDDVKEPFGFKHGGKTWQLKDAREIDYMILMNADKRPDEFLKAALPSGDWDTFRKVPMSLFKLTRVTDLYMEHHGYVKGETDGGEQAD